MTAKVLFIIDSLDNGGAERQLALLVKHLPLEWEHRVWSLGGGPFATELRKAGVVVHVSARRWRWDILPALSLWRLIWAWRPDIVHSCGYMSTLAAVLFCKWLRIPLVDGTIRTATVFKRRRRIWLWTLQWGDRIIANSHAGLEAVHVVPPRGRVVYNGFDPDRLKLCPNQVTARNHGEPVRVVMVARMQWMKDYATYIEAARLLTKCDDNAWRFLAIGDGPSRAALLETAQDLLERNVLDFPRAGMEVLPYVSQANVGVLLTAPGVYEGCSNAIMEYMACGLPVICTDSGGNRELVGDGETGFVVPPQDVKAVVERLVWLRAHPHEASAMGQAARQRLLQDFTVEKLVQKTLSVYEELLVPAHP